MTEAVVSLLVEQLGAFLYHEIENEVIMVVEVKKEIQELTETLKSIQAVLHDAEKKKVQDETVKVWLENLKDVIFEIEDVLDDWNIKILKSRIKKRSLSSSKNVCSHLLNPCFCVQNSILLRHSVGQKVKEIRKSLESISSRKNDFHLASGFEAEISRERTSSLVNVSDVYGRQVERDAIICEIFCERTHSEVGVPVISVVGLGGLGKTTLAQFISEDINIVKHFGKPLWVCVSEPFDKIRVAKSIIVEAGVKLPDDNEWNTLHCLLEETLKHKLFLLILDDVWTEDINQWSPFKICLDRGAAGSRVLVTTRKEQVAMMMNSVYSHPLGGLREENSWELFQSAAHIGKENRKYKAFKEIGKAIVLKCKGVPLSVKTLGSMLQFKTKIQDWQKVLESEMWSFEKFVDTVYPALSLSYYDLPSSWKPCFMYCATFPKDHILEKDVLIKLWMAHGFLYSSHGTKLEEIGEDYFNGIISRSLFQDVVKNDVGDIQSCKMHDLVHDFVHFLSNKKTRIIEGNGVTFNNLKLHHLTVCSSNKDISTVSSFDTMKSVRTLNMHRCYQARGLKNILRHWTNLRSLDISSTGLLLLPAEIEKLIHLRYLDLSHNDSLVKLPNTLGNLCNLQTFNLNQCSSLRGLPTSMGKLINLRHLELDDTYNLRSLPKGIEKLPFLLSLSKFIVEEGRKLSDMKRLNLIQRKVEISGLCQVTNGDEAKEAELGSKRGFRDLKLNFEKYGNVNEGDEERMEDVSEALQPPPHLEELSILKYPCSKLASWMNDRSLFLKLRVLNLHFEEQNKCTELPSLGQLPLLEKFTISSMRSLQRLDLFGICENKKDAFPKLIEFRLYDMFKLEEWVLPFERSDIIQIMPRLRTLYIDRASKLKALPAVWKLESLEELEIGNLKSVRRVGPEFFGIAEGDIMGLNRAGESLPIIIFPKLIKFELSGFADLEEWLLPFERSDIIIKIMPCLRILDIQNADKLKALPAVWKLESLEQLIIGGLKSVTRVGPELFGISENDVMGDEDGESLPIIIFPNLKELDIGNMPKLEEWEMKMPNWREDITFLIPCLNKLELYHCPKLKVIPPNIFSYQLVREWIEICPELKLPTHGTNQIIKWKEVGESSGTN